MKQFFLKHKCYCRSFYVLSRCACLGHSVIRLLGWKKVLLNHQKSRVDYLSDLLKNPEIRVCPDEVIKHLDRKYIAFAIEQQEFDFFSYTQPDVIFMDSFSELTDQLFVGNENRRFLANYSDINHDEIFKQTYRCQGLLDLGDITNAYEIFFGLLQDFYPGVPIVFLHFPIALETRDVFRERADQISTSLEYLSAKFPNLHNIQVDEGIVGWPENCIDESLKEFPYHYSENVYLEFARKIEGLGIRYPLRTRFIDRVIKKRPNHKNMLRQD